MLKPFLSALAGLWASLVRTVVPYIVGYVMNLFVTANMVVDSDLRAGLETVLTLGFGVVYYLLARVLETYVSPWFSVLLGSLKSPDSYSATASGRHEAD